MELLIRWILFSLSVFIVARVLPGIRIKGFATALWVAFVYGVIKVVFGWLLTLITLPAVILTFGLFLFVINAVLLWITDKLIDGFEIRSFGMTLLAAFLITLLDSLFRAVIF